MEPDYLFVGAGIGAVCLAGYLVSTSFQPGRRGRRFGALLWILLGAGLLTQGFAPHLQIGHNAFVMPQLSRTSTINPAALVARERSMQILSALLSGSATLGLAFYYRRSFLPARSPLDAPMRKPEALKQPLPGR